ncbi:MAG: hypothetical protein WDN69_12935 [Aliidongia sp.]
MTALGGYAMTAITAPDRAEYAGASRACCRCRRISSGCRCNPCWAIIGADAVKTGMLGDAEAIAAIAGMLPPGVPVGRRPGHDRQRRVHRSSPRRRSAL